MKYIAQITDCGPLAFRAGREPTTAGTLGYVPGTALMGGLAAAHSLTGRSKSEFDLFFMANESRFGNLYPAQVRAELQGIDPIYPLPTTASSCKRFGGFVADARDKDDLHHGVFDTLIPWALFALSEQSDARPLNALKSCPRCGEPLDRLSGFYRRDALDVAMMGESRVERGLRTRTGISRATGAVEQSILYSREVLHEGSQFWGTVSVPDAAATAFEQFVQDVQQLGLLRLGNNRTRGFGRVTLDLTATPASEAAGALEARVAAFDAALRKEAQVYGIATPHQAYVPLTLWSDTILTDELLRYRRTLWPGYLAKAWNLPGAEVVYQNTASRQVMGWSELWRLPKPDVFAIAMGSVMLLGFANPLTANDIGTLLRIQTEGLGVRRLEGFGEVTVASPFHWEVRGL